MPRELVDTTVLFAATYRRDGAHEDALPILQGIDTADLPEAVIIEYVGDTSYRTKPLIGAGDFPEQFLISHHDRYTRLTSSPQ